jgi:tRNA/tmRNA/rRNA uracil-C5-methylase (TrmA/RlmC/RlmD family)
MSRQRQGRAADAPLPLSREPTEVDIDGFTHGGEGVARIEGKAVFVAGALPGERVVVRVTDDRARWARADLVEVLTASPDRVVPPCPMVPECGGCDLQHASPEAQLRLKTRVVREQLARLAGLPDAPVEDCRAVGPALGYRNHARFHAGPDGRLGFHRAASHEVVPIDRCLVLTDGTQRVRTAIGDATGAVEAGVRAADGHGIAVLRPGPGALTVPTSDEAPDIDLVLEEEDGSTVALRGEGVLRREVAGLTLAHGPSAFFQVNDGAPDALVAAVLEACGDVTGALVWDLYAGVGLFALPLARAGAEVVAVESDRVAAAGARDNAAANDLDLAVVTSAVDAFTGTAAAAATGRLGAALVPPALPVEAPDLVVLDPPRAGAGAEVIGHLIDLAVPTIVMVACDVASFARDVRLLTDAGMRLERVVPFDLFPMTHHVELVATLRR